MASENCVPRHGVNEAVCGFAQQCVISSLARGSCRASRWNAAALRDRSRQSVALRERLSVLQLSVREMTVLMALSIPAAVSPPR
jgi:hypothetical protein